MIHSSVSGHLGWLHVPATLHNTAVDPGASLDSYYLRFTYQEAGFSALASNPLRVCELLEAGPTFHLSCPSPPASTRQLLTALGNEPALNTAGLHSAPSEDLAALTALSPSRSHSKT